MIRQVGPELQITGLGRTYSTATCWEQKDGLGRTGHAVGGGHWSTVCKMNDASDQRATVRTTITARGNRIHFDETGQYQFHRGEQNCTASCRRTRSYVLVQRQGHAPEETRGDRATEPQAQAQTILAPVEPGQRHRTPEASLETRPRASKPGLSEQELDALLEAPGPSIRSGALRVAPHPVTGTESVGSQLVRGKEANRGGAWLLALASCVSAVFGGFGLFVVFRGRAKRRKEVDFHRLAEKNWRARNGKRARALLVNPPPRKECPVCGEQFQDRTRYCGKDGAKLRVLTRPKDA